MGPHSCAKELAKPGITSTGLIKLPLYRFLGSPDIAQLILKDSENYDLIGLDYQSSTFDQVNQKTSQAIDFIGNYLIDLRELSKSNNDDINRYFKSLESFQLPEYCCPIFMFIFVIYSKYRKPINIAWLVADRIKTVQLKTGRLCIILHCWRPTILLRKTAS